MHHGCGGGKRGRQGGRERKRKRNRKREIQIEMDREKERENGGVGGHPNRATSCDRRRGGESHRQEGTQGEGGGKERGSHRSQVTEERMQEGRKEAGRVQG